MISDKIPMKIYKPTGGDTVLNPLIPKVPGVYFIWSKRELLYIGKTNNLQRRIAQHMSINLMSIEMINPEEVNKVAVIFTIDEYEAEKIEQQLIKLIPTKWNSFPLYKHDWYYDWKFKRGMFAELPIKDKQISKNPRRQKH